MINYHLLETGFFYADGGAMFGAVPKRSWQRRYPCNEQNTCLLSMRCLLVWDEERVIVLESGVGSKDLGKLGYYRFHDLQDIRELVRSCGFKPEQVTDVVLSHLHFDHCGGCTYINGQGALSVTFPNAKHWISRAQWENFQQPSLLEEDAYRSQDIQPLADVGLIHLVEHDLCLMEGFDLKICNGHTVGQLVSTFDTIDGRCIFPSDVIPTRAHLSVEWLSAYDTHPIDSILAKTMLNEELKKNGGKIVFYHDAYNKSAEHQQSSSHFK